MMLYSKIRKLTILIYVVGITIILIYIATQECNEQLSTKDSTYEESLTYERFGDSNLPLKPSVSSGEGNINDKTVPPVLKGLVEDMRDLKGRHSDFISQPCQERDTLKENTTQRKYDFVGPFSYLKEYKNPCWYPDGSSELKCVCYFYLIGMPKSGTTDVFHRIFAHPHVTMGERKEAHWFDNNRFQDPPDQTDFKYYVSFFKKATKEIKDSTQTLRDGTEYHHKVLGEATPQYLCQGRYWPKIVGNEGCSEPRVTAMSHIHHLWPKAKLIISLRNPVSRLLSDYLYLPQITRINQTAAEFDQIVKQNIDQWYSCVSKHSVWYCIHSWDDFSTMKLKIFKYGFYSRCILNLLKLFPRDQIHIIHNESYSKNITGHLEEIYRFLDLPLLGQEEMKKISTMTRKNKGRYWKMRRMWPSTWKLLEDFYAPYNAELSAMLDGDPRWLWKS